MTEPMSDERLEQIKARVAAATPGPWDCYGDGAHEVYDAGEYSDGDCGEVVAPVVTKLNDAEFIAFAREDIPALLNEIDRLHEEVRGQRSVAKMNARVAEAAYRREDKMRDRLNKSRVVTDEMVERGAEAFYHGRGGEPGFGPQWDAICADWPEIATVYRRGVRAALEAALGGGES